MTYATLAEMTARYSAALLVALTDRGEVATGGIDAAIVERALEEASAMIEGCPRVGCGRWTHRNIWMILAVWRIWA
jgi:phage gp36-like protein